MEKRFVGFLVLSVLIMWGFFLAQQVFNPQPAEKPAEGLAAGDPESSGTPDAEEAEIGSLEGMGEEGETADDSDAEDNQLDPETLTATVEPQKWITLGSAKEESDYRLLVLLNNRGAAIERIELTERRSNGAFRYGNLEETSGYLGVLAVSYNTAGQAVVGAVGPGTPAALAVPNATNLAPGLQAGDVVEAIDEIAVGKAAPMEDLLRDRLPGQTIQLKVLRAKADDVVSHVFSATLTERPLALVRPDLVAESTVSSEADEVLLSCLMSLRGEASKVTQIAAEDVLHRRRWEVHNLDEDPSGVEFKTTLSGNDLTLLGLESPLEVTKRFHLRPVPSDLNQADAYLAYQLDLEVEFKNLGAKPQEIVYQLNGVGGLPLEGAWYSYKIHTGWFKSAGNRDVVWSSPGQGFRMLDATQINRNVAEEASSDNVISDAAQPISLDYVGVETKYFMSAFMSAEESENAALTWAKVNAVPRGTYKKLAKRTLRNTDVSVELISKPLLLKPQASTARRLKLFAGPKSRDLLSRHGLDDSIYYGWPIFALFAGLLTKILHGFHWIVGNYGIAIIMLTVLVRGMMFPLSRKAAKNAARMQELAPEIKAVSERHKNDMEKRNKAMMELYAKHNFHPLSGCLPMFLQLPVFIGLYKALAVDIELREAPLIPGIEWCSNLAAPDMLARWDSWMPSFIGGESTGWLGPYFNFLPVITIVLFILQQKLFTPPPTDDQQKMQQQIMKFMMVFMGVLFFKVPSGLCLYFIASSTWGIAERLMLPKPTPGKVKEASTKSSATSSKPSLVERLTNKVEQMQKQSKASKPTQRKKDRRKNRR